MANSTVGNIETSIADYGMSTLLIFGNIGNTVVILIFRRYPRNVSAIYLSSGALFNILYLSFNIPLIINSYHGTDPSKSSVIFCKFQSYCSLALGQIARYIFVCACLDRYLATNRTFTAKNIDRVRLARRLIILSIAVWCTLDTHHLFHTTIRNGICGQHGNYYFINRIFLLISFNTVPPVSMTIFGYLAFRQIRRVHIYGRPRTDSHSTALLCRNDRKFLTMIFTEVVMYFLTMLLYLVTSLHLTLKTNDKMKNGWQLSESESIMLLCSIFISYINHAAPFYLYLCLSREFRHDFIRWFDRVFPRCFRSCTLL